MVQISGFESFWRGQVGLDKANLPTGFKARCFLQDLKNGGFADICPAEGGWTITYEDQPEFAPDASKVEK